MSYSIESKSSFEGAKYPLALLTPLVQERGEKVSADLFPPLSVGKRGVTSQLEGVAKTQNKTDRKLVKSGDLVINSRSDRRGAAGLARKDGSVSPVYNVMTPKLELLYPEFAHHLFRSRAFQEDYFQWGVGIVDDLWSTNFTRMSRMRVPLPPKDTQQRIADYLDREVGQIDAMVGTLDELAETLEVRRKAAMSRATSRGIDGAAVIDSGNPDVGLMPKHWAVTRFGAEFVIEGGQVDPREEPWASMVLVAPNHIVSHRGQIVGRETARDQRADSGKYFAREGQILYSKIRPALNKVAIAREDCLISADMYALSSRTGSDHRYLVYLLLSSKFHRYVSEISMRVKMPKVNRDELSLAALALPPRDEQKRISDHLDKVTGKIDAMLAKVTELKSLLIERRAALITDVVTGKKEVPA